MRMRILGNFPNFCQEKQGKVEEFHWEKQLVSLPIARPS